MLLQTSSAEPRDLFETHEDESRKVHEKSLMYELHEDGSRRRKLAAKIEFERFNPPYFSVRVTLLVPSLQHGARLLKPMNFVSQCVPTVNSLGK